jgi:hypothetical protein
MTAPYYGPPPVAPPAYGPPPPPRGPGVQPPFPAPPVEGKGKRLGLSLGIGAGVLLLICGGGVAAAIGLGVSMTSALSEQAHKAVSSFLDALHDENYVKAYSLLCDDAREKQTPAEFTAEVSYMPPIASYTLGAFDLADLSVPIRAQYETGASGQLEAHLGQDQDTGALEVCSVGE